MNFGVESSVRDAHGLETMCLSSAGRGFVRLAAGRVHYHFLHVGILQALKKRLKQSLSKQQV